MLNIIYIYNIYVFFCSGDWVPSTINRYGSKNCEDNRKKETSSYHA